MDFSPSQTRKLLKISRITLYGRSEIFPLSVPERASRDYPLSSVSALYIIQFWSKQKVPLSRIAKCDRQLAAFCQTFNPRGPQKEYLALALKHKKAILFSEKDWVDQKMPFSPFDEHVLVAPISRLAVEMIGQILSS